MYQRVVLDYDPLWRALEWAKKNCPSYITNTLRPNDHRYNDDQYHTMGTKISYYFGDEKDAVMFALRWG